MNMFHKVSKEGIEDDKADDPHQEQGKLLHSHARIIIKICK